MTARWLRRELESSATDRILDAAGSLFASRGVARTNMGDVAIAAGCSRATLYRDIEDPEVRAVATWVVRVVVAFLVMPGESEQAERETLHRFVAPAISSLASTKTEPG